MRSRGNSSLKHPKKFHPNNYKLSFSDVDRTDIEDDEPFRESMKKLVKLLGYAVEAFSSPSNFLACPFLSQTACLVADVQMPGITGAELHRHLVAKGHGIPTILVTVYLDDTALHARRLCHRIPPPFSGTRGAKKNVTWTATAP